MPARLVFVSGSKAGVTVELEGDRITIGRQPESDIRFEPSEVLVSGRHASIEVRGDVYTLRDHGSRNGTFVNRARIDSAALAEGDFIEFGPGGPSAHFAVGAEVDLAPTLDLSSRADAARLAAAGGEGGRTTTREFMAMAYRRSGRRLRRTVGILAALTVMAIGAVVVWQQRSRAELESVLQAIAAQLESERATWAQDLATIQSSYDSLLDEVERSRERLAEQQTRRAAEGRFAADVNAAYGSGVALIVFSYGYEERDGSRLLRLVVDRDGNPVMQRVGGRWVPQIGFEGDGPPVAEQGSATGFLVDSTGWILTNRHVAEPWAQGHDLEMFRANGLDVEPRFIVLRAFFPPGAQSYDLEVERTSERADVALLRTLGRRVDAPVVPMAAAGEPVSPGEQVVFIGYPTGVFNLLFRVPPARRSEILEAVGDKPVELARALAQRGLIQPLVIAGTVSDTTDVEIIHTAGATGGGSGGPLIGATREVVGIHYAAVRSPIAGDPFQTQRGVRVSFAWDVLPPNLRTRLTVERSRGSP